MKQQTHRNHIPLAHTSFFVPAPRTLHFPHKQAIRPIGTSHRTPLCNLIRTLRASADKAYSSRASSALNPESARSTYRYIDLRTMKLISENDAHMRSGPVPNVTFGVLDNQTVFDDEAQTSQLRDLLFTQDTIPLNDTQKQVVQSLLSRHSVLYMAAAGDERDSVFIDIVMRNRLWKECVVYCAASRRSAEAMYAILCAQLGPERRAEVCLDLGDGVLEQGEAAALSKDTVRVVITLPHALRNKLVTYNPSSWIANANIIFIDNFSVSSLEEWEELLLAIPTRILLCIFMKEPATADRDLLPLWLEAVQNSVVAISPSGAASLRDRIDRPDIFPLLRTFAYNAALHESPVQLSFTIVKEMMQRECDKPAGDFVPKFSECFLHGVDVFPAEKTAELQFGSVEEAEYADVASLVVGDAKMTESRIRANSKKRSRARRRKDRAAVSRAAARRRRKIVFRNSLLMPAIVLTNGRKESEHAAFAIRSALGESACLLWDDDSRELLEDLVKKYEAQYSDQMSETDIEIMQALLSGIGIVHDGCAPAIRLFVEELFRGQLIPVIVADTHLGSTELLALPCAKSVLVESSALALCDDPHKGLIKASTAAALAGRMGKDDVGNLIALWYDEDVDDEAAGNEIASTLLYPLFSPPESAIDRQPSVSMLFDDNTMAKIPDLVKCQMKHTAKSSVMSSSYDGVLRSLRRFGVDGFESILDYTLRSYKGWLQRASLHATVEKMQVEKRAIDEKLEKDDKNSIADHERRLAKMNEANRVARAMRKRYASIVAQRMREGLQLSQPGRIIGVRSAEGLGGGILWSHKLLTEEKMEKSSEYIAQENGSKLVTKEKHDDDDTALDTYDRDGFTAAVFVAVRDQGSGEKPIKSLDQQWVVVCVLADGLWTMLPLQDVVGLSREEEDVVPNVDLLMVPHPVTFDFDPSSGWATCAPVDESEKAALYRISDELIGRVASEDLRPVIDRLRIPEYEAQRERLERFETLYKQSPWYGRDDELTQRRQLRRRAAELGDDIIALQHKENELEEKMFNNHSHQLTTQSAVLAILEDCHAVKILGDREMQMTPIGALGSVLPGRYPLFTAACLSLIDDIERLSVPEFAAFIATVVSSERIWKVSENALGAQGDDGMEDDETHEELDMSMLRQLNDVDDEEEIQQKRALAEMNGAGEVLPSEIAKTINDILTALQQLHRRHRLDHRQDKNNEISEIVPAPLNTRLARAVYMFSSGVGWREVVEVLHHEEGYGVRELRRVRAVLDLIVRSEDGEFSDRMRKLAAKAFDSLDRWPVRDRETIVELVDSGVVEKHWSGNTYEKWWRSVRDEISTINGRGKVEDGDAVETAVTDIMESH